MVRTEAIVRLLAFLAGSAAINGCKREERRFEEPPLASPRDAEARADSYLGNAWALSEGQRLFAQMNCVGCHAHGGGGMGPPLMDARWLYGGDLKSIRASIVQGRPNGMPAFGAKLSEEQVWQLAAYVRSLSGNAPSSAAPVRDDHMAVRPPPSRTKPEPMTHQEQP
jgi:cytochrome c oxidase cbb3-type subunit III